VDSAGDLTENYSAAGVPALEHVAPSDLHGVIGAGLFNFKKPAGDSDCRTVPLPFIIIANKDRAY
jgi:hypothetical protein